nr:hypothetical protein [Kibdelosporangium sp. MJ126-NF4]
MTHIRGGSDHEHNYSRPRHHLPAVIGPQGGRSERGRARQDVRRPGKDAPRVG